MLVANRHTVFAILLTLAGALGIPAAARAGFIPLPNPSFEIDNDNNGYPDQWIVGFGPVLDKSGAEARTGQSAVKINANARIFTNVFPPRLSALTFRGWMRAVPAAGQFGVLQIQQYSDAQFLEITQRQHALTADYARYGVNMRPLPGANRMLPFFNSSSGQTWVWFDDMDLLTDSIDNGSFESIANGAPAAWTPVGMPTFDTIGGATPPSPTAVVCNRDNYYFQPIACSPTTRTYTLEFRVRAAQPAADSILVKWFDGRGNYFDKTEIAFQAGESFSRIVHHFAAPPLAVWGEVALQPVEPIWFWFDEIYLGWQNVETPLFTPNGDGINDKTTLHYTLSYDAATTVSLLNAQGQVVATLAASPLAPPGTYSVPIEGLILGFLSEGHYKFRLQIGRSGDVPHSAEFPVQLRAIPAWLEHPNPAAGAMFAVGIWEYVFGIEFATHSSFADLVSSAAGWNFNAVLMLFLKESDFDAAYAAADGSPIQAVTNNFFLTNIIDNRAWPSGFNEFATRDLLLDYTSRFGANPNWFGIYLKDEPFFRDTEHLRAATRIAQNVAPVQLPLSTFSVNAETQHIAERVNPPVLMYDYYPVGAASILGPDEWTGFLPALNQMRAVAQGLARPWWLTTQGFFNSAARRPLIPAEQRALAGLTAAHGASGIWYFIRSTFGGNEGLLDDQFLETAMIPEIAAQNSRLRQLEPWLLGLQPLEAAVTLDDDQCLANGFTNGMGIEYIIVVNKNTLLPRSCRLTLPQLNAGMTPSEVRLGPGGRIPTPLPHKITNNQMTIALPAIAPGDWMLIELAPPDIEP